jgi:mannose-6-phosphate isomerase-like protein (cupin superfamily)
MKFIAIQAKGLKQCLVADSLDSQKLRVHISEIEPGTRAHPPHRHAGIEAFHVLEGNGVVEVVGERQAVGPNEVVMIDASKEHGLVNTGSTRMKYVVIIAQ